MIAQNSTVFLCACLSSCADPTDDSQDGFIDFYQKKEISFNGVYLMMEL
jgi:hypothetical protein